MYECVCVGGGGGGGGYTQVSDFQVITLSDHPDHTKENDQIKLQKCTYIRMYIQEGMSLCHYLP